MKTIYLDANYMCHAEKADGRQAVETDIFDAFCDIAIECYRYIPKGQSWMRPDGEIISGEFIQAIADPVWIQKQYELDNYSRFVAFGIPQEKGFTATCNYSIGSFVSILGQLYEVILTIPQHTSLRPGQNVIETTVEHYLDTLKEE